MCDFYSLDSHDLNFISEATQFNAKKRKDVIEEDYDAPAAAH